MLIKRHTKYGMSLTELMALSCLLYLTPVGSKKKPAECDCGPLSENCEIEDGEKVCDCEYLSREVNGTCKAYCEKDWHCENGGICVHESCKCLPGTSGDTCDSIEGCGGMDAFYMCGDPREAYCAFDEKTRTPYCKCSTYDFLFYDKDRRCVECDCGDGTCSLVDGKKTCKCNEGAAVSHGWHMVSKTDRCLACNCGDNSIGCSFDGTLKVCECPEGFAHRSGYEGDSCNECDCGPHGECYFNVIFMRCRCNEGYRTLVSDEGTNVTCVECDCGPNGRCSFKDELKHCSCYLGYEELNGTCTDMDECLQGNICGYGTDCINTSGDYECVCKQGYVPSRPGSDLKKYGCEDLNECDDAALCPVVHTTCRNFEGSYNCSCEDGYLPVTLPNSLKIIGCGTPESNGRNQSSSVWKFAFIILCVAIGIFIIITFIIFCLKRKPPGRSPHGTNDSQQKY